ncbi:MAG: signal peptidase I [Pseudomonadota bacterium]
MAFSIKNMFSNKGIEGETVKAEAPKMTPAEEAWDLAKTVFFAVAIALVLRIVIFQPFNIPSGSMKPNLLVGDFLIVSKPTFGYSRASLVYPLTRLPLEGRLLGGTPDRGDVVVFKNRMDGNKDYIKRVVGMPGDQIRMMNGVLHINGVAVQKEQAVEVNVADCRYTGAAAPVYRETLPNGITYIVQECSGDTGAYDNVGPYQIPADCFFMMGDNRDESQDSRVTSAVGSGTSCGLSGAVHKNDIVGRAERLFFSVDGSDAKFWQIWKWPFAIRYGRLLDKVE